MTDVEDVGRGFTRGPGERWRFAGRSGRASEMGSPAATASTADGA